MSRKIAVFAGGNNGNQKYYSSLAYQTGKLLAKTGFDVITGAGTGLMNEVLRGAVEAGGKTIGVALKRRTHSKYITEKILHDNLRQRQQEILFLADAFLALPGGIGTLYEIYEILALKKALEIKPEKPLILIDKYFLDLKKTLLDIVKDGFFDNTLHSFYDYADTPKKAISILASKLEK